MSADRHLKARKGRASLYYFRAVPKDLQCALGKTVIEQCLHTSDNKQTRLTSRRFA